ncbi:MAG TPA: hypothetical protein VFN30_05000 [Chitinophagaceae bacterium]|nr:hypothetical protein [Chitinophagaceae bacterium]
MGFTETKYREVVKQLQSTGQGNPKGRSYHVCYGDSNEVDILDVWDSMEDFEAFGKILIPTLTSFDIKLGQPNIQKIFGTIEGK